VTKPQDKLNVSTLDSIHNIADIYKEHLLLSCFQKSAGNEKYISRLRTNWKLWKTCKY